MEALINALDTPLTSDELLTLVQEQIEIVENVELKNILLAIALELESKYHNGVGKSIRQRKSSRFKALVQFFEEGRHTPPLPTIFDDTVYPQ
ncbi:MAG: hypothetical protein RL318_2798 [Fibrobacterota bacterium]|jgi:hypothetical protein